MRGEAKTFVNLTQEFQVLSCRGAMPCWRQPTGGGIAEKRQTCAVFAPSQPYKNRGFRAVCNLPQLWNNCSGRFSQPAKLLWKTGHIRSRNISQRSCQLVSNRFMMGQLQWQFRLHIQVYQFWNKINWQNPCTTAIRFAVSLVPQSHQTLKRWSARRPTTITIRSFKNTTPQ